MSQFRDIELLLEDVIHSSDFIESIKASGETLSAYDQASLTMMAEELKTKIIEAYLGAVSLGAVFDVSTAHVGEYVDNTYQSSIKIFFDGSGLYRPSLFEGGYTEGAYDIFGLITRGYSANKEVYGIWRGKRIASLIKRPASNFLSMVVEEFENLYPGIEILLPDEWSI